MKTHDTADADHGAASIALAMAIGETIIRDLIIPTVCVVVALIGMFSATPIATSSQRTQPQPPTPVRLLPPAPVRLLPPSPTAAPSLDTLRVPDLRRLAREQGMSKLARRGRKQELIQALTCT